MSEPSISELFARDPLTLSQVDIDAIIAKLRQDRVRFIQGDKTAGKPESKKSATQKKNEANAAAVGDLDLSDLGL